MLAKTNRFAKSAMIGMVAAFALAAGRDTYRASFPDVRSTLSSPNKQLVLINRDADNDAEAAKLGDNHALFLRNSESSEELKILSYGRHVEALWSPDSELIAITDLGGSSDSYCHVYRVANNTCIDGTNSMMRIIKNTPLAQCDHLYFRAARWDRSHLLKVTASGYGEGRGHEARLIYNADNSEAKLLNLK